MRHLALLVALLAGMAARADYLSRPFADDTMYFLVLDRFAKNAGDGQGLDGVDPANPRYFHGGNLKAATARLDYIQALGATAIWMTPIFVNQTFSTPDKRWPGSTGYHGYWILNFLDVDPHFGTEEDLARFVAEAHRRDIKVFLDIVVNHTADVIRYKECPVEHSESTEPDADCPYRSQADYPYSRTNPDFEGDDAAHQTAFNFARLTDMNYAYTPYIPKGMEHAKTPDWLNDLHYYHNRGNSKFKGESSLDGDFGGLDDVFTENPRVVEGFIEIYKHWIERFRIDGYRVDTARHVNVEFWQKFNPAILNFARSQGIPNFFIFGEIADFTDDSVQLARFTREAKFPGALDFAFYDIIRKMLAGQMSAANFPRIYAADSLFDGPDSQPTFVSNHDDGRLGYWIRRHNPFMPKEELAKKVLLGNALMMFGRGVPILYYGDEQGFIGTGNDAMARQDMFASLVPAWQTEEMLGAAAPAGQDHFDSDHPFFKAITEMTALRAANPGLRHGKFVLRELSDAPDVIAFSRIDRETGVEYLVAFNLGKETKTATSLVESGDLEWTSLRGACSGKATLPLAYKLSVPALDYVICQHRLR